jgi:hypothetical protein
MNIAGATAAAYTPTASLLGQRLRLSLTASNPVGSAEVHSAAATIVSLPVVQSAPAFSYPSPHVGNSLTVTSGTWTGTGTITYRYQWQYWNGGAWVSLSGATAQSYTIPASLNGRQVRATVTATNSVGSTLYGTAATGIIHTAV